MNALSDFWSAFDASVKPYAHPADLPILSRQPERYLAPGWESFEAYVDSAAFGTEENRFQLSLLPVPYGGNLQKASIFILLLNPGFEYGDYYAEMCVSRFRQRLIDNLAQQVSGQKYPFIWLDPKFCRSGGFRWWESKLRDVVRALADEAFGGNYQEALRHLASRMAHVELVPYHSASFSAHSLVKKLPSVLAARQFVQGTLVPAAQRGDVTVVVTRSRRAWEIEQASENLVIYEGGHTRGASLSRQSAGGQAILRRALRS